MALYALEYRFPPDNERRLAVRARHRAYLEALSRAGHVVAAGPFDDDSGALILYSVSGRDELERLLADDPYVQADVFGERIVRGWQPFIGAQLGYIYGDNTSDTWVAGPEAGVKYFINSTTFVVGAVEYQFFFDDSDDASDNFDDGQFIYSLGLGVILGRD